MNQEVKDYIKDIVGIINLNRHHDYNFILKDIIYDEVNELYVFLFDIDRPPKSINFSVNYILKGAVSYKLSQYGMLLPYYVKINTI
jgi:hypothetical protein